MENMILSLFELSVGASLVIFLMLLIAPLAGKKLTAKWRYWIWLALALRLLLPIQIDLPQAPVTVELPPMMTQTVEAAVPEEDLPPIEAVPAIPEDDIPTENIVLETETIQPVLNEESKTLWKPTLLQLLGLIWAAGAAAVLCWQIASYIRYCRKTRPWNRPVTEELVLNIYEELCLEMGIKNVPELVQNRRSQSPMLIGLRKPTIVLPEMNYSEDDYTVILSHELNHYKRHDLWYKLLVLAALCIHWFNPLVWLMLREADNDLEISCDEAVVKNSSNDDRAQYCEAILRIMCRGKGNYALLSTGVNGGKKVLQRRFAAVLNEGAGRGIALGAVALCLVVLSGTFVACQVREQEESPALSDKILDAMDLQIYYIQPNGRISSDIKYAGTKRLLWEKINEMEPLGEGEEIPYHDPMLQDGYLCFPNEGKTYVFTDWMEDHTLVGLVDGEYGTGDSMEEWFRLNSQLDELELWYKADGSLYESLFEQVSRFTTLEEGIDPLSFFVEYSTYQEMSGKGSYKAESHFRNHIEDPENKLALHTMLASLEATEAPLYPEDSHRKNLTLSLGQGSNTITYFFADWVDGCTMVRVLGQWYKTDESVYDMVAELAMEGDNFLSSPASPVSMKNYYFCVKYSHPSGTKEREVDSDNVKSAFYSILDNMEEISRPIENQPTGVGSLTLTWGRENDLRSCELFEGENRTWINLDDKWYSVKKNFYQELLAFVNEAEQPSVSQATTPPAVTSTSPSYTFAPFRESFKGLDVHSSEFYESINYYTVDEAVINKLLSSLNWSSMEKTAGKSIKTDDPDSSGPYLRFVTDNMEQLYLFKDHQLALHRDFAGNTSYYNMPTSTYNDVLLVLKDFSDWKHNPITESRAEPFDENYDYLDLYEEGGAGYSLTVRTFCEMLIDDLDWDVIATRDLDMATPSVDRPGAHMKISANNGRHLYIYADETAAYYTGHGKEHCFKLKSGSYQRIKGLLGSYKLYRNSGVSLDTFPLQDSFRTMTVSVDGGKAYLLDADRSFRMIAGVPSGYCKAVAKNVSFSLEGEKYVLLTNKKGESLAFVNGRSQARYDKGNGTVIYYELGADYYDIALTVANALVQEQHGEELRYNPPTGQDSDLDHWIATRDMKEVRITLKQKDRTVTLSDEEEKRELYGYLRKMEKMTTLQNPTAAYSDPVTITITSSDVNGSYVYDPNNMGYVLQGSDGQYRVNSCIEDIMAKYFGTVVQGSVISQANPATAKPVIYLYPEETTEVSIKLDYNGKLTTTYPAYKNGWTVTAHPDGSITDGKRDYYCLFWEGISAVDYDLSSGFVVKGSETEAFLEKALSQLGLTDQEANEFIIYWLPRMEQNPYNLISFQEEQYTDNAKLTVTPEPDSILRVFMAWKGLEQPVSVPTQELKPFHRHGFTLVEWGGSEM